MINKQNWWVLQPRDPITGELGKGGPMITSETNPEQDWHDRQRDTSLVCPFMALGPFTYEQATEARKATL